jgi:hypothetical protein
MHITFLLLYLYYVQISTWSSSFFLLQCCLQFDDNLIAWIMYEMLRNSFISINVNIKWEMSYFHYLVLRILHNLILLICSFGKWMIKCLQKINNLTVLNNKLFLKFFFQYKTTEISNFALIRIFLEQMRFLYCQEIIGLYESYIELIFMLKHL